MIALEKEPTAARPWSSTPRWSKGRILVVEDHSALNFLLGIRLHHAGFEVESAFDGQEGIARALRDAPDLILLDLGLPKISGEAMLGYLRSQPDASRIPVIVLTGRRDHGLRRVGDHEGLTRVLHKPMPAAEIVREVEDLLGHE